MTTDSFSSVFNSTSVQITLKLALITILTLFLLIPKFMILELISEREKLSHTVTDEVAVGWGNSQLVTGPVLVVPYYEWTESVDQIKKKSAVKKNLIIFPEELIVDGQVDTKEKYRSIYKVLLFQTDLKVNGKFTIPQEGFTGIDKNDIFWNEAFLVQGISDIKGMKSLVNMTIGNAEIICKPGTGGITFGVNNLPATYHRTSGDMTTVDLSTISSGIVAPLRDVPLSTENSFTFSYQLQLNGSKYLYFAPVGKTTQVHLTSIFPDPSFTGAYLPEHTTDQKGFDARWKILEYNKNLPEYVKAKETVALGATTFGVEVTDLVNHYDVTYRTGKYMILFIVLTFLVVFLTENVNRLRIHIFQYTLIGFALVMFFTLLLSVSEFTGYNMAYFLAASATITLLFFYSQSVFKHKKSSLLLLLLLVTLFTYIYLIIQMEKMALLAGTLGLFVILAATMYATQKIKWYEEK